MNSIIDYQSAPYKAALFANSGCCNYRFSFLRDLLSCFWNILDKLSL